MERFDTLMWRAHYKARAKEPFARLSHGPSYRPAERLDGINKAHQLARKYGDADLVRMAEKAVLAAKLELERIEAAVQYRVFDLVLWKDHKIAYVEVKAPNDRLSQEQRNTIERNVKEGTLSWVTYVKEAGG